MGSYNINVFESVCAFLNRSGGHLFLGVEDKGNVVGIDEEAVDKVKKDFVTSMNNPQKISPTFYLSVEEIKIDEKIILHIFVPESSQVHRCNSKIFDRNEDGDIDITDNTNLVSGMYMRKQGTYTENRIFPFAGVDELNSELFMKVRKMATNERIDHPWKFMNDLELLKSAGLFLKDPQTGKEGITLGGILIFGKEELIHAAMPHYRTDAILRKINLNTTKLYSGSEPTFIEGDIFKTIIPLIASTTEQVTEKVTEQIKRLLEFCSIPRTRSEMQVFLNLHHREHFRTKILNPLIKGGLLKLTIPEKPTSSKQKYYRNK